MNGKTRGTTHELIKEKKQRTNIATLLLYVHVAYIYGVDKPTTHLCTNAWVRIRLLLVSDGPVTPTFLPRGFVRRIAVNVSAQPREFMTVSSFIW